MTIDRLAAVHEALTELYEQLAGQERGLRQAEESQKARIRQQIRSTWQEIRECEAEYALRLGQQVKREEVPEAIAEVVVAELVDEIEVLEPTSRNDEVRGMLQRILAELQKPDSPASAKLKVAIPIIPNVAWGIKW